MYRVSSRTAKTTQRNPLSGKKKERERRKEKKKKKAGLCGLVIFAPGKVRQKDLEFMERWR